MVDLECSTPIDVSPQFEWPDDMASIVRSILVTRCKYGASTDEIIEDYKSFTGESLLTTFRERDVVAEQLRNIPGVYSTFKAPTGPFLWFFNSESTQHLTEMINKQKSPRSTRKHQTRRYQSPMMRSSSWRLAVKAYSNKHESEVVASSSSTGPRDKFFEDNNGYIPKRNGWRRIQQQRNASTNHPYLPTQRQQSQQQQRYANVPVPNFTPLFCGFQMIGDDFFLSLARWELGFSFDPGHSIQRSGFCISGLTIAEAADRVMRATLINDRVIVNIGVVDILHGHDYVDMQMDLIRLMKCLEAHGATVIITTVSPLANTSHIPGTAETLYMFNDFIRKQNWRCIDLWKCFVNERNQTLYECFQPGPRSVSGSTQPHVLWNKLGRQRIIKYLKTELAKFI